jgi:hypothetical protein
MSSFTEENYGSRSLTQDFESPFPTTTMNFVGEESEASDGQAAEFYTFRMAHSSIEVLMEL